MLLCGSSSAASRAFRAGDRDSPPNDRARGRAGVSVRAGAKLSVSVRSPTVRDAVDRNSTRVVMTAAGRAKLGSGGACRTCPDACPVTQLSVRVVSKAAQRASTRDAAQVIPTTRLQRRKVGGCPGVVGRVTHPFSPALEPATRIDDARRVVRSLKVDCPGDPRIDGRRTTGFRPAPQLPELVASPATYGSVGPQGTRV